MKIAVYIFVLIAFITSAALADHPAVAAISTMDSVCVKLTDTAGYVQGSDLSYQITHWPDAGLFAAGSIAADSIQTDPCGIRYFTVSNLKPKLWSPQDPQLYEVTVSNSAGGVLGKTRFGFRTFEVKGNKFYLNARPIFLRGMPINPPGRDLPVQTGRNPEFIRGYIKLIQSAGVNLIRTESQDWLDACDESGVMVFTGNYGPARGDKKGVPPPFEQAQPFYRDMVLNLASHPGVVIYILTNEVDYKSKESTYKQFLTKIRDDIRPLDPTRPVIGNAGFGMGEPGEVYDLHPYAGWYSGSIFDWYSNIPSYISRANEVGKPLTMSECVGAYTSDSGDFMTMSKQLCNMTRWVGGAENPRAAALDYQAELVKQIVEISRRARTGESGVAGTMPFTYFFGWTKARKAEDLIIKPAFEALKTAYQPVLISPECLHRNLYAGDNLKLRLCVSNDDDSGRDLAPSKAEVEVVAVDGKIVAAGSADFAGVPYYSNAWADLSILIPSNLPRGYYNVRTRFLENGQLISHNSFQITVAPRKWVNASPVTVTLYDPSGNTGDALTFLGIKVKRIPDLRYLPNNGVLIIGEGALDGANYPGRSSVLAFLNNGGRILCLCQEREKWQSSWLPADFIMGQRRSYTYIHPVGVNKVLFKDLTDRDLRFWNQAGVFAGSTPDVFPIHSALGPSSVADLKSARVWASCGRLLSEAAIVEIMHGHGSVLLSQFVTVNRVKSDPIAAKLLSNLITYAASGKSAGLIDLTKPVRWDMSAFRTGVFTSMLQGFLPHSKVYKHEGSSKGLLGENHRIDGFTLLGNYQFDNNGWLRPVPDPKVEGWGIIYGTLSHSVSKFALELRNAGDSPAQIALKVDDNIIGPPVTLSAGEERIVRWDIKHAPGPVDMELRGDQRLVITESSFD